MYQAVSIIKSYVKILCYTSEPLLDFICVLPENDPVFLVFDSVDYNLMKQIEIGVIIVVVPIINACKKG